METPLQRMELLIGENNLEILKRSTVMVVGVGGVGSYAAEALARSGVGTLILVDGDTVAPSNLNRQIHAVYATIGRSKTEVMKERIESYRRDCTIICKDIFPAARYWSHHGGSWPRCTRPCRHPPRHRPGSGWRNRNRGTGTGRSRRPARWNRNHAGRTAGAGGWRDASVMVSPTRVSFTFLRLAVI